MPTFIPISIALLTILLQPADARAEGTNEESLETTSEASESSKKINELQQMIFEMLSWDEMSFESSTDASLELDQSQKES
jgi:hypothetical protein